MYSFGINTVLTHRWHYVGGGPQNKFCSGSHKGLDWLCSTGQQITENESYCMNLNEWFIFIIKIDEKLENRINATFLFLFKNMHTVWWTLEAVMAHIYCLSTTLHMTPTWLTSTCAGLVSTTVEAGHAYWLDVSHRFEHHCTQYKAGTWASFT